MKFKYICLLFFILLLGFSMNGHADEIETLKKHYIRSALFEGEESLTRYLTDLPRETVAADQVVVELMSRYPATDAEIRQLLKSLKKEGYWTDINYAGQKKSGWEPTIHAERILILTKAFIRKNSSFYHSEELAGGIHAALDYWFEKKLVASNWWYNEIGVPRILGSVFILFEDELGPAEMDMAIGVMSNSRIKMTGQNKVWLAGNVLIRGLLEKNSIMVRQARDTIASEIVVGSLNGRMEGIQRDHSFHQHGAQQQFGNYGAAYIADMSFWSKIFAGTSLAIEQSKLDILSDLINKGFQRVLWKGYLDVNGLGRQFYKQAQPHKAISTIFSAHALSTVDSKNRAQYESLIKSNFSPNLKPPGLPGVYHFWKSDQTVSRRQQWMTSVKMSSRRVLGAEAGNGDNLKGYYLADGATYTYVDGDEYNNIFPVWDWRKLPGVTAYETQALLKVLNFAGYKNNSSFVGNVTDGQIGLTSMQLNRDGLMANKSWVFTRDYVFCMGSSIRSDSGSSVTTSIEQRLKRKNLLFLEDSEWTRIEKSEFKNTKDARFFHDKTGYIALNADKIAARDESRTGTWADIMRTYPKDVIEQKSVISIWLDHGKKPQGGLYQYFILPASNPKQTASFDVSEVQVISNTDKAQAVFLKKEKLVLIAAYWPVDLQLPLGIKFKSRQPGLYLLKYGAKATPPNVIFTDPTQELKLAEYEINGKKHQIDLSVH